MMTRAKIGFFVAVFVVALVAFMPLSLALSLFGLTDMGLSARWAGGTIWSGRLIEARIGRLAVGDVAVGLQPFPLFVGRARVDMASPLGVGGLTSTTGGYSADDVTAKLSTARLLAPIPLDSLDFTDVTVAFSGNKCVRANGRLRANFSGEVGGLSLAQGLSGDARCDGGVLLLPLVSQSAIERLNLRIQSNGDYRAEFVVRSTDTALAEKLGTSGFAPTQGGFVLRLAGKL